MYRRKIKIFVIIASVSLILIVLLRPSPPDSRASYEKLFADKVHTTEKFSIIVAGDSRVYRGVSPEILENNLPEHDVLNFGFSAAGFNNYFLDEIEKKMDTLSQRQVVIVLGITPYTLTSEASINEQHRQEMSRSSWDIYQRRVINPFLAVFDPVKPTDILRSITRTEESSGYFVYYRYRGWVDSDILPVDTNYAMPGYQKVFTNNPVSSEIMKNLMERVRKWTSRNICVVGFRVPSTVQMEQAENKLSGFDVESFRASFKKAGGIYLEIKSRDYQSYDGSHLRSCSAEKLSLVLADSLKFYCLGKQSAEMY